MNTFIEKVKEREKKKNYFEVIYNGIIIKDEILEELKRAVTLNEPKVDLVQKKDGVYYTILMVDPDAPYGYLNSNDFVPKKDCSSFGCTMDDLDISYGCIASQKTGYYGSVKNNIEDEIKISYKCDPRNKTFLHWWVSNIVYENGKLKGAEEWVSYYPPTPPEGKHRYYFYLIEQTSYMKRNPLDCIDDDKFRMPFHFEIWSNRYIWKILQTKGFIVASPTLEEKRLANNIN